MMTIIAILTNLRDRNVMPIYVGNVALVVKNHATTRAFQATQLVATVTFIIYIRVRLAILSGQAVSAAFNSSR